MFRVCSFVCLFGSLFSMLVGPNQKEEVIKCWETPQSKSGLK